MVAVLFIGEPTILNGDQHCKNYFYIRTAFFVQYTNRGLFSRFLSVFPDPDDAPDLTDHPNNSPQGTPPDLRDTSGA